MCQVTELGKRMILMMTKMPKQMEMTFPTEMDGYNWKCTNILPPKEEKKCTNFNCLAVREL